MTLRSAEGVRFIPFAVLGGRAGFALFQRLTTRQFRLVMSALLVISGIGLLGRGF